MMSFKHFLLESERTEAISVDHALAWMEKNSKDYLKRGNFIFRGVTNDNGIMLGNPGKGKDRVSKNTHNLYTLWIDNHPSFKDFPKRSKSFICTTNVRYAGEYGLPYIVIPKDASDAGVCPSSDIWGAEIYEDIDMIWLNGFTGGAIEDHLNVGHIINTYPEMVAALKQLDVGLLDEFADVTIAMKKYNLTNMFEFWEKFVTPKLFKLTQGNSIPRQDREVWLDTECVFISTYSEKLTDDDKDKILKFANNFPKFKSLLDEHWDD